MTSRKTLCSICGGLADHPHSCHLCGAVCCDRCFRNDLGLCVRCARGRSVTDRKVLIK